ncbi:MAG: ABC transporter [Candidatus Pacebacteria bacterium CG10_big_fil_rev_8_21_14_0_10_42_12]|nr:MAG: ABC transporter [Candidatus Pacebacteria bacterium CG10_big_fil_rev_8_21_14_0_10_42_12]
MNTQILLSLLSGIMIGGIAAYLGTLMLSKKMSVVAGPLAHLAFPGVAIAILFGFDLALGVFPFVLFGAVMIWLLEKKTKLPMENLTALVFAVGVGTSLIFLPIGEAEEALVGNIMQISLIETLFIMVLSAVTFFVVQKLYSGLMLININENLMRVERKSIDAYNLGYLVAIAVVVSLGVYLVGGLITAALIAIPAGAAKNVSKNLKEYKLWAVAFGVIGTISGIFLSLIFSLPAGPMVIVSGAFIFMISLIFQRKV